LENKRSEIENKFIEIMAGSWFLLIENEVQEVEDNKNQDKHISNLNAFILL